MRPDTILALALVILCAATSALFAEDWPQLGGPNRDCISTESGLIQDWPEGGPKELWTVDVGKGYAGPVIYDGAVYLLDRLAGKQDILRSLSLQTGKELWRYAWDAKGAVAHPGSRAQALVEEDYVFAAGPKGDLYCVDRKTHEPLWHKQVLEAYDARLPRYGFNQTPLAYKDTIILTVFGKDAGVVALEKSTGKEVWASEPFADMKHAPYSSPVKAIIDDGTATLTAVLDADRTAEVYGGDVDDAREQAREAMDQSVVADTIRENVVGRAFRVRGHLSVDDYGANLDAAEFEAVDESPADRARALLEEAEA